MHEHITTGARLYRPASKGRAEASCYVHLVQTDALGGG